MLLSQFLKGIQFQRIAPIVYGACGRLIIVEHSGRLLATYLNESFVLRAELALQLLSLVQVFWVRVLLLQFTLWILQIYLHEFLLLYIVYALALCPFLHLPTTLISCLCLNIFVETYTVWVKKNPPPCSFLTFFPKQRRIFNQFLHTYYTFLSTLD